MIGDHVAVRGAFGPHEGIVLEETGDSVILKVEKNDTLGNRGQVTLGSLPGLRNHQQRNAPYVPPLEVTQVAACNRLHEVDERLARWLLMSADIVQSNYLHLTQESIALMLGTRRSSVTVAAGMLETAGLISNARGKINIVDRARLEEAACVCYKLMRKQLAQWRGELHT